MHHLVSFILRVAYAAGFGFILLFHTEDIINYIPQLLGGLLMLENIAQLVELSILKMKTQVNWGFFLVPGLIMIYSLILIFFCSSTVSGSASVHDAFDRLTTAELMTGGFCFIAFIISEFVISYKFRKPLFQPEAFAQEQLIRQEAEKQSQNTESK